MSSKLLPGKHPLNKWASRQTYPNGLEGFSCLFAHKWRNIHVRVHARLCTLPVRCPCVCAARAVNRESATSTTAPQKMWEYIRHAFWCKFLTQSATRRRYIFLVLTTTRTRTNKPFILCLGMKSIRAKQTEVHFAYFVHRGQLGIIARH